MEKIEDILGIINKDFEQDLIIKVIMSNNKKSAKYKKITLENKTMSENFFYQYEYFCDNQVLHKNISCLKDLVESFEQNFLLGFKQIDILGKNRDYKVLINKKLECTVINTNQNKNTNIFVTHNKAKNYILKEGEPIKWLINLGVMTENGKVINSMQKKFRQINKFLEMVADINDYIKEDSLIVDFGCGKSYLTFAIYHYFNNIKHKNVQVIGLDLKKDVVNNCNKLAEQFEFHNLNFVNADIKDFKSEKNIEMIITLHACDTATDYAIYNAMKWNAKIIMTVPCCQHELNKQLKNEALSQVLSYGILRERFASILTDTIRATLMEYMGYKTTVMEFIETEHTPKNIMIRGILKNTNPNKQKYLDEFLKIKKEFEINQTLFNLIEKGVR